MARRALLIGSQTYGLAGCNDDVSLMTQVLAAQRFDTVATVTDGAASRAGIIAALEHLVADTGPTDAVVLYYSGHGGRVVRPDFEERKAAGRSTYFQFIVPFDMESSAPGDFRGLLSEEITVFQRRLTDAFLTKGATPNVTTILDCCHSGYMARAVEMVPKSVDLSKKMFRMRGIREHAQQLAAEAASEADATNPDAVRLVACQPEQSAYEMESARGGKHGALTDVLASVLEELGGQAVAWSVVGDFVRRRVRALVPEQRPEVEGPTSRLLFSAEFIRDKGALPITVLDGASVVEAAALLGVEVGDEFRLEEPGREEPIGTAVVTRIDGANAVLSIALTSDAAGQSDSTLPARAQAVRATTRRPKYAVAIDVDGTAGDELRSLVDESIRLRVSRPDEPVLAKIEERQGLAVLDSLGALWSKSLPADASGLRSTVELLEAIAVGQRLLELPSGQGDGALDAPVDVSFGVVRDGALHELDRHGQRLKPNDRVSLVVRNASSEQLYLWIFDVGVSGRSALLTNAAPSGRSLGPCGAEDDRIAVWSSDGGALFWPGDVPGAAAPGVHDAARQETFVIVIADRRGDLSSLATPRGIARGDMERSELEMMLDDEQRGVTRDVSPQLAGARPLRYRLEEVSFFLTPV